MFNWELVMISIAVVVILSIPFVLIYLTDREEKKDGIRREVSKK